MTFVVSEILSKEAEIDFPLISFITALSIGSCARAATLCYFIGLITAHLNRLLLEDLYSREVEVKAVKWGYDPFYGVSLGDRSVYLQKQT